MLQAHGRLARRIYDDERLLPDDRCLNNRVIIHKANVVNLVAKELTDNRNDSFRDTLSFVRRMHSVYQELQVHGTVNNLCRDDFYDSVRIGNRRWLRRGNDVYLVGGGNKLKHVVRNSRAGIDDDDVGISERSELLGKILKFLNAQISNFREAVCARNEFYAELCV